jgi:4-alpha-glucanotransferase
MNFPRACGVLLHPTSLAGPFGVGDLGPAADGFIRFLASAGQSYWQVLPLGPTGFGDSPYACFSAFAGNPLLISPELLVEDGLLAASDVTPLPFPQMRVDFGPVIKWKAALLFRAFEAFSRGAAPALRSEFDAFRARHADWLDDYALFRSLKDAHGGASWDKWETDFSQRAPSAITFARERLRGEIDAHAFYQFLFDRQWERVRSLCAAYGMRIIGDIPIFVAYDSSDVWANRDLFKLEPDGTPKRVSGVPPDYYSATGQLWGNPLYDWKRMQADGFAWWIARMRRTLETVDVIRMDHFRGFAACWEIPHGEPTAINGEWVVAPGRELFTALREALGELPVIAEDLGVITPDVVALRDQFDFPGMRILQFGFGGDAKNADLPHNYVRNSVAYTGTHDNDTAAGWFNSRPASGSTRNARQIDRERAFCLRYLNADGKQIHWDFIRAVMASVSDTALVPLQDVLGLGNEARMNLPGSDHGNWSWRSADGDLTEALAERLRMLAETYDRCSPRSDSRIEAEANADDPTAPNTEE